MYSEEMATADKRGRITLGAKMATRYGKRFYVVPTKTEIILIPADLDDPIAELRRIGREARIGRFTVKELKKMAEKGAIDEISGKR